MSVFIIAEAGVNHNGSVELAKRLIDEAALAGADAVKFQAFRAGELVAGDVRKAEYQRADGSSGETQGEMLARLELPDDAHEPLLAHAAAAGIAFLSTPFDSHSLELLTTRLGLDTIKVASGEITNAPFLLQIARTAKRVILSTGMSSLAEVEAALGVLAFGFTAPGGTAPGRDEFARAYESGAGRAALRERVSLLHCTTEYPAPAAEVNLRAMDTMRSAFGLPVGYSDHTNGIHIAIAAVARGASIIEKHFTLDRTMPGPDHAASLVPSELRELVAGIRETEAALGDGVKRPTASELKNLDVVRRSIVAAKQIRAGDLFAVENIACKRSTGSLTPAAYWETLGKVANRDYDRDEPLDR